MIGWIAIFRIFQFGRYLECVIVKFVGVGSTARAIPSLFEITDPQLPICMEVRFLRLPICMEVRYP